MKTHTITLTLSDKELDIIMTMLDICCRSVQIIADDPNNPLDGLHNVERTKEERTLAKQIIQKFSKELL